MSVARASTQEVVTLRVSDLEGRVLDAWVAKVEGWTHLGAVGVTPPKRGDPDPKGPWCTSGANDWWRDPTGHLVCASCDGVPAYSTDWALGGPIMERNHIAVAPAKGGWVAYMALKGDGLNFGDTMLTAAMRCRVASILGETLHQYTCPP